VEDRGVEDRGDEEERAVDPEVRCEGTDPEEAVAGFVVGLERWWVGECL